MSLAVFRADASLALGIGHVMRCSVFAQALAEADWRTAFACNAETIEVHPSLVSSVHDVVSLKGEGNEAGALRRRWPQGCDLLVVDHYQLGAEFETATRDWAGQILAIDDLADRPHDCDLLLDTALGRKPEAYEDLVPGHCRLLLGPRYALLRPQFAASRAGALARRGTAEPVRRILVSLGGTDPADVTMKVLGGIGRSGIDAEIDVVTVSAANRKSGMDQVAGQIPQPIRVLHDVTDMAGLMVEADIAVGAGGSTTWERCCLGLPTVVLTLASNQAVQAKALTDRGAAICLGWHEDVEIGVVADAVRRLGAKAEERHRLSVAAATLCDGEGAGRVVAAINLSTKTQ